LKELQGMPKARDGNSAGSDNDEDGRQTIKWERDVDTNLAEKRRRRLAKALFEELRSLLGANLTEAGTFDRNSILLHAIQLIQKLTGKDESSTFGHEHSKNAGSIGAEKFEQAEIKNKKISPSGEASNLPREERKMMSIIRQIDEMEHMAKAMEKRSKADEIESDPEVEDLSRDVPEQCGKKFKTVDGFMRMDIGKDHGSDQNSYAKKRQTPSNAFGNVSLTRTYPRIACKKCMLSEKELRDHFNMPLNEVAKKFSMCTTALKKLCRKYGVMQWPHRKLRSLEKKIASLRAEQVRFLDSVSV